MEVLNTEDGANLVQGFKRANNILTQAEEKDGVEYSFGADVKFAETEEEVSEKFFAAMDVDKTGDVEVAELFRAGAYLRADGLEKRTRVTLLAKSRKKPVGDAQEN